MKARFGYFYWREVASVLLFCLSTPLLCLADLPAITSIKPDGTNVIVEVRIPAGFQRITLESRARFGAGTWSPVAVGQNDGSAKIMSFTVPCSRQTELMRVRADARQALPESFYNGATSFSGASSGAAPGGPGGVAVNGAGPTAGADTTRAVVESDIWKIDGTRLYFFNQYRGLQVIDITTPDKATVTGTLELPAAGEQMYLTDSNHVVLLVNGPCGYANEQSQVYVVDTTAGHPTVVTNLPVGGWLTDSRMVGTALYVASQNYRPVTGTSNTLWEWGTSVRSFDLSDPAHPLARTSLWYSGYGNLINANDTYCFVVTQDPTNWWQSVVQIIDITSPDATMNPFASIRTTGHIQDKFKLDYNNNVFTTISEDWHWSTGSGPITRLETFTLPDPRSAGPQGINKLGQLELGSREQLHATRFDGNLVYVVTFFQIDPLWVVDLSDPAKPHIAGSVNVPGWSSYIQPMGDRLVTVGVESNRVAVSLFDVHNPAQPALLSRQILGENYSWSDANYDEKAFTVLPDQGLILVPYNGDTTNGWTSQVQLLDLTRTNVLARGIISHQCQPRRTAFAQNRVLSLSGWELLSVDITDRDHPQVKGDTQLAWSVDRLFVQGEYLLEIAGSTGFWGYQSTPAVRVTPLHQHDNILNQLALDGLPIVGAARKDSRLYLAQSPGYWYPIILNGAGGPGSGQNTNPPNFFLTIVDLSQLPKLSLLGHISLTLDTPGWGSSWTPVWPKDDFLVWAGGSPYYWWWGPVPVGVGGVVNAGPVAGGANSVLWPWWGFGNGGQLLAFDVSDPREPVFRSEVNLATNGWWSFSQPFLNGSRVYLSHNRSEVVTNTDNPNGVWMQRPELDVIDYADPDSPTVRKPVSIPGTLQGMSHQGELLYTVGTHWTTNQALFWTQWLDASAYDGVAAHLVDSLPLPDYWLHPVLVADTNLFLGRSSYSSYPTNVIAPTLETWSLSDAGKFTLKGSVSLAQPVSNLLAPPGLLVVQENDNSLDLFDDSTPAALSLLRHDQPAGCLWYDLNHAEGDRQLGLWVPLGVYGVREVSIPP